MLMFFAILCLVFAALFGALSFMATYMSDAPNETAPMWPAVALLGLSLALFALHHYRSTLVALIAFVCCVPSAFGQTYCTTVTGTWGDISGGLWQLSQNSSGVITGTFTTGTGTACRNPTMIYDVTSGRFGTNGQFTMSLTLRGTPNAVCPATYNGDGYFQLGEIGCARWFSSTYPHPYVNEASCPVPVGESSVFIDWLGVTARFTQTLTYGDPNYNWGGRTVQEGISNNFTTCAIPGSSRTVGKWNLYDNTYVDGIGPGSQQSVTNVRNSGPTPCYYTFDQTMYIDCPSGDHSVTVWTPYTNAKHSDGIFINPITVSVSRNGAGSTEKQMGQPAPDLYMEALMDMLILWP